MRSITRPDMRTVIGLSISAAGITLATVNAAYAEGGLPQFNPDNFSPQLVWLAIAFVVLYLLMSKVALPRVSDVLEDRQHRIDENLKKAEHLRSEAEAAEQAYEKALAEARASAHDTIKGVRDRMAEQTAQRQSELGEKLAARIAEAEAAVNQAKQAAMGDIADVAVQVTSEAYAKLLGDTPDQGAVTAAVQGSLKESA